VCCGCALGHDNATADADGVVVLVLVVQGVLVHDTLTGLTGTPSREAGLAARWWHGRLVVRGGGRWHQQCLRVCVFQGANRTPQGLQLVLAPRRLPLLGVVGSFPGDGGGHEDLVAADVFLRCHAEGQRETLLIILLLTAGVILSRVATGTRGLKALWIGIHR
jgi:hypothetical protein